MPGNISVLFIMELIGTAAFSCSGAMVAIKKNLDLLGIVVLGVITAVGGGMMRDVLLGIHPPTLFLKPVYVTVAVIAAIIIFLLMRSKNISRFLLTAEYYDWTMNLLDAIGLGAFTVVGVNTSISAGQGNFQFLTIFLGVITGVGGGLLRDMMACEVPAILRKHVYACASIGFCNSLYTSTIRLIHMIVPLVSPALNAFSRSSSKRFTSANLNKIFTSPFISSASF